MLKIFRDHPWMSTVLACDVMLLLFLLDQINKWFMLEHIIHPATATSPDVQLGFLTWITALELPRLPFISIEALPFMNIVMVWNEGISFGLFAGTPAAANGILMGLLAMIILGFAIWIIRTPHHGLRLILAAIIGGALGNLWDRVRFGAVADFYDFHIAGYHYPAFNVADSAIVLGVIGLIIYEFRISKR